MVGQNGDMGRHTAALLGTLMEQFPDMIHSVDAAGNIVFFNGKALELLGYTADELGRMNIRQLYAPEVLEAVEKGFSELKEAGQKEVESVFVARDGTRIPVELRTVALRADDASFVQTFTVSRDLRKLKEEQDRLLNAGRLAAVGELAAGVVQDLGNPLASVSLAVSLLQQLLERCEVSPDGQREQAAELLAMVRDAAEVMGRVTSRLRGFTRNVKESYAPVDLFDVVQDALVTLGQRLRASQVQVVCPVVKARHWMFGERKQMVQVFLNLFVHACEAMAGREVRQLSIGIDQGCKEGRYFWRCAVTDTGAGYPPEALAKLFEAFRTPGPEASGPAGAADGFGLCVARSVLAEHGGTIDVESTVGAGTVFRLWIPAYTQRLSFVKP